jgi:epoxyqueuosine reductase
VICVASRYSSPDDPPPPEGSVAASVARYARGRDYHNRLRARVRRLAAFVRTLGEGVRARPIVDTAPVLERAWAARAGLGFVGKNGLVIAPGQGSYLLLGEVVTTLALAPDTPIAERCGECTRCLDACPTGAFPRPFVLDARRCVSYLTIELRGPMPEPLRAGVGENLFGCDVCQDVCPFNRTRRTTPLRAGSYASHERWQTLRVEDLLDLGEAEWQEACVGTPLARATPSGLVRNAVTVIANRGDRAFVPRLERLAREHPDGAVREHAAWAVARLEASA